MLPVGLIGLGKHGARYLEHIRRDVPDLRVAALCRRDEAAGRALAAEIGARFHRRAGDLIADPAVRAVIAVVPPIENGSIVEAAVCEGKPILLEKPLAAGVDEAFRLRDRVESSGLPFLMGQTLRFSGVVRAVTDLLPSLGRVSQIALGQSFEPTRLDWLDDPARSGGGNVLHTGVHLFDLMRYLTGGEVVEAVCIVDRVTTRATEDSFAASLRIEPGRAGGSGEAGRSARAAGLPREGSAADSAPGAAAAVLASAIGSRATRSRSGSIRVVGESGQIFADHVQRSVAVIRDRSLEELPRPPEVNTVCEILRLFRAVAEGTLPPPITVRDGAAAVAVADACYRSAASGGRVRVRTT